MTILCSQVAGEDMILSRRAALMRIEPERIHFLNSKSCVSGQYILYWMQASQRAFWNPALELAVDIADERKLPVIVAFRLSPSYPEANLRHYEWMLRGLQETAKAIVERGMGFIIRLGHPPEVALELAGRAAAVVTDRGYLRHQRLWRQYLAERAPSTVIEVEGDAVVPVEIAYPRQAARANLIRHHLIPLLSHFLTPLEERAPKIPASFSEPSLDLEAIETILPLLELDNKVKPVNLPSGTQAARKRLENFLEKNILQYANLRSDPSTDVTSGLSPYLHFGQISPVEVALSVLKTGGEKADEFLEQLIVRRELAINFVWYNANYDEFHGLPRWARDSLLRHASDPRPVLYKPEELESGQTHDPIWNMAQVQLVNDGRMHNSLRMYWGKRLLVWTRRPEEAFRLGLYLNNKYALDGRDPSSYAGVGWCVGLHDRPFPERPIFGYVRPMTPEGIMGKFPRLKDMIGQELQV